MDDMGELRRRIEVREAREAVREAMHRCWREEFPRLIEVRRVSTTPALDEV